RAGILIPSLVVPEYPAIRICHPHELRHGIRQSAELFFTAPKCLFRLFALAYVPREAGEKMPAVLLVFAKRDFQRNFSSALMKTWQFCRFPIKVALPCFNITAQPGFVQATHVVGH